MYSFDLIIDRSNNYNDLLKTTANYFNLNFYRQSDSYADAFNDEKKFIVSASPSKISFMLPESADIRDLLAEVVPFIKQNFYEQTVGVRCIGKEENIQDINIQNVNTVLIR